MLLRIVHRTQYDYSQPVQFGVHRLLVRPLEGHDVQIRSSALSVRPAGRVRWVRDGFDNSVALVDLSEPASQLFIESQVVVEQYNTNPFDFVIDKEARELPFAYAPDERIDFGHYLHPGHPQDQAAIRAWTQPFLGPAGRAGTLDFLTALNRAVPLYFRYVRREEPGTQTPGETLRLRQGSCRDFALLFMEAARGLGLAARFVTGYLCMNPAGPGAQPIGSTHAWTEIYLPGAGWKGFDSTGGILAADLHVRVGVARLPSQAAPITGSYLGPGDSFQGMRVDVKVELTNTI
jgi:transglutaminase-like putative cysteine protease